MLQTCQTFNVKNRTWTCQKQIDTSQLSSWNSTSNFTDFTFGVLGSTQLNTLHNFSHIDTWGFPTKDTCWVPWNPGSMSNLPGTSFATFEPRTADSALTNKDSFMRLYARTTSLRCPDFSLTICSLIPDWNILVAALTLRLWLVYRPSNPPSFINLDTVLLSEFIPTGLSTYQHAADLLFFTIEYL